MGTLKHVHPILISKKTAVLKSMRTEPEQGARMRPNLMHELEEGPKCSAANKQTSFGKYMENLMHIFYHVVDKES